MSTCRKCPQTQEGTNEISNALETQTKLVVNNGLGGTSDVEVGGAGPGASFEVLFSNLVLELQEMRTQIGLLSADTPAQLHVLRHTVSDEDHGCRICCPKMY